MSKKQSDLSIQQIDSILENAVLTQADFDLINSTVSTVFIENGKVKQMLGFHKIDQDIAFIDWLNFTVKDDTFKTTQLLNDDDKSSENDFDLVINCSKYLCYIFGFGLTVIRNSGAFFYDRSYEIGNKYGMVCHGGQSNSLLVSINGTGLSQASTGWEYRLYNFLNNSVLPNITRIDLAHDDFEPSFFTVDNCLAEYLKGSFKNGKRNPSVSQAGNWIEPDGRGRTFYIGKRTNGLFCRIYEKGLQLQSSENPNWVRCEVELKSVDRIIPLEVLLRPHEYFAGSFPIFNQLNQIQTRVETYQHEVKADLSHRIKWGKRQSGGFIKLLSDLDYSDIEIIQMLKAEKIPKSFKQKFLENDLQHLHEIPHHISVNSSLTVQ